jgi:hypothetical protein
MFGHLLKVKPLTKQPLSNTQTSGKQPVKNVACRASLHFAIEDELDAKWTYHPSLGVPAAGAEAVADGADGVNEVVFFAEFGS